MNKYTKNILKRLSGSIFVFILLLLFIILYYKSKIFKEIFLVVFSSYVLAYILKPIHLWLMKKGFNKKVAAGLLLISIIGLFSLIIIYLIPSLFRESLDIDTVITEGEKVISKLTTMFNLDKLKIFNLSHDTIYDYLNLIIINISQNIVNILIKVGESFISLAVIPIITYYLISEGDFLNSKLLLILPTKQRQMFKNVAADIDKLLSRYIVSQLILCLIIGILTFLSLIILKVDFPIWLSILNAIMNIIPYFGPMFGAIPAVFIALLHSTEKAIWTAILLAIIQQIEGDIISPKIIGDSISIHPIMIILLLLLGEKIAGFIGMVLAVPVAVIIKVIYEDINYHLF